MIYCPKCKGKTEVYSSENNNPEGFKRYRKCKSCLDKFVTYEVIQTEKMDAELERKKHVIEVSKREYEAFLKVMQAAKHSIHLMR